MSQFFDNGITTEEVDTDITGTGVSIVHAGSDMEGVTPVLGFSMQNISDDNTSIKQFNASAGLKLGESDTSKIINVDYTFYNDSDYQDAINIAYVFRGKQITESDEAYEIQVGVSKKMDSDYLSGGDSAYVGGRSKLAMGGNNYFLSKVSLGMQTDTVGTSGAYIDNGLALFASLGLAIAPVSNVLVNVGVTSNMQNLDYYDQFGNYLGEEARFMFGFDMGVTVVF